MTDEAENEPLPKRPRNQGNYGELEDILRDSELDDEDFEPPSLKSVTRSGLLVSS